MLIIRRFSVNKLLIPELLGSNIIIPVYLQQNPIDMPKKKNFRHLKRDNGRIMGKSFVSKHVVKIDKLGDKFVVTLPLEKSGFLQRPSKIEFYLHEPEVVAKVEAELEKMRLRGVKILITGRAFGITDGDNGVWPPFVSKKLKGCVMVSKIKKHYCPVKVD
jgi:hypothetical protein